MVISYINSKWSMGRRLALIAGIFLIPSMVQLYIYADQKLAQISAIDREIMGASLAGAVWSDMSPGRDRKEGVASGELQALQEKSNKHFSVGAAMAEFVNASAGYEKAVAGKRLLRDIGTASGLAYSTVADTYQTQDILIRTLPAAKVAIERLRRSLTDGAQSAGSALAMDFSVLREETSRLRSSLADIAANDSAGESKRAMSASANQFVSEFDHIAAALQAVAFQRSALGGDMQSAMTAATTALAATANAATGQFVQLAQAYASEERMKLYGTLGLLLAATLAAIGMVTLLGKGIALRLGSLVRVMDLMSRKDLSVEIPYANDANENGLIAQALGRFKEALAENKAMTDAAVEAAKVQQEQGDHYVQEHERFMDAFTQAADRIARGDFAHRIEEKVIQEYEPIVTQMNLMMGQLEDAQGSKIEAEKQINLVVSALGASLADLADGNLETGLNIEVAPEFAKLKADFNSAASELKSTIALVKKSAGSIKLGTDEISEASDDLSRRTENQAASLEETAAAVKEITDTVNKTAQGATHARETVSVAKADAEKSGEVVRKAIDAMNGIENSSKQISQIIGVIDEIAFQTNLLALNAGVEAARAGDAGRGFAVVASEVRALAQRSAEAAKEIKGLISASTGQVSQGVQLVGETGLALTRIVTQVTEINSIVSDIAASANEQAHGLEQVNTAVNEMDQVTQQNAAMVEEATAATQALAQQTEDLARLVSRFRTGEETVVDISSRREAPKAEARQSRPTMRSRIVANGSMRKAVGADVGWEEF